MGRWVNAETVFEGGRHVFTTRKNWCVPCVLLEMKTNLLVLKKNRCGTPVMAFSFLIVSAHVVSFSLGVDKTGEGERLGDMISR